MYGKLLNRLGAAATAPTWLKETWRPSRGVGLWSCLLACIQREAVCSILGVVGPAYMAYAKRGASGNITNQVLQELKVSQFQEDKLEGCLNMCATSSGHPDNRSCLSELGHR